MTGVKTNERPGTRAVLRHGRVSAYKARQVLDLIRGQDADRAAEILATCDRGVAEPIGKVLASAVANAVHNDGMDAEDLYVSACYADEGSTLKRWRPRARSCHPHSEADLAHHGHREQAPRRSDRPAPGPAGCGSLAASPSGGGFAPAPPGRGCCAGG